ncbi:MAG: elongation factor P maturation arginine rhamnosyltransferase EarP [Comamonas sp.]
MSSALSPAASPAVSPGHTPPSLLWDIFCRVIDNHGDLGVCWRLAADLAARGQRVRLWVDDPAALAWMAPRRPPAIAVIHWTAPPSVHGAADLASGVPVAATPGDVVIEAFGCEIDHAFMAAATGTAPHWINLEYLSAEDYVERSHGLPSPVMSGPAAGRRKFFFYPGFTPRTGGLLREGELAARQAGFDRSAWLAQQGLAPPRPGERRVSLFCYEPAALPDALQSWGRAGTPLRLLVTPGRAQAAVRQAMQTLPDTRPGPALAIHNLPYMQQPDFDGLLQACDLNFVRGEDSLVRALWAGQPFVWQIYPQHDHAHEAKLAAFLDRWLDGAPAATATLVRQWHAWWNGLPPSPPVASGEAPQLSAEQLSAWRQWALVARQRLWRQDDLVTQLTRFIGQTG